MINLSSDWYKEFYNTKDIEEMVIASENQIKSYIEIRKGKKLFLDKIMDEIKIKRLSVINNEERRCIKRFFEI